MTGALATKIAELLIFLRATISWTTTEFKMQRKPSSNRSNSGQTYKLTDRDRCALEHIVGRKHQTTAAKVTAELNQHLNSPVSTKTVRDDLNKAGYHGRAVKNDVMYFHNIFTIVISIV